MDNGWFKHLIIFSDDTVWSKTNLLHRWKSELIIEEALSSNYIEQCGTTDIGDQQYRITDLGKKIIDN